MVCPRLVAAFLIAALPAFGCAEAGEQEPPAEENEPAAQTARAPEPRRGRFEDGKILTDTFDVRHHLSGDTLTLVLDTDLPDNTDLMVGVGRTYTRAGSSETYTADYYSTKSKVGRWRTPQEVRLDNDSWRQKLDEQRRMLASVGESFQVGRISDDVRVSFVVPVNQDDSRFGQFNKNLVGSVVEESTSGLPLRNVTAEVSIGYPLEGSVSTTRWADPQGLEPGKTYVVERRTPLTPHYDPPDPIAAIEQIIQLPSGSRITVRETKELRYGPWYRVEAASSGGESIGSGWINSTALIGQNIEETE